MTTIDQLRRRFEQQRDKSLHLMIGGLLYTTGISAAEIQPGGTPKQRLDRIRQQMLDWWTLDKLRYLVYIARIQAAMTNCGEEEVATVRTALTRTAKQVAAHSRPDLIEDIERADGLLADVTSGYVIALEQAADYLARIRDQEMVDHARRHRTDTIECGCPTEDVLATGHQEGCTE